MINLLGQYSEIRDTDESLGGKCSPNNIVVPSSDPLGVRDGRIEGT